jgi:hypothetical protein
MINIKITCFVYITGVNPVNHMLDQARQYDYYPVRVHLVPNERAHAGQLVETKNIPYI